MPTFWTVSDLWSLNARNGSWASPGWACATSARSGAPSRPSTTGRTLYTRGPAGGCGSTKSVVVRTGSGVSFTGRSVPR